MKIGFHVSISGAIDRAVDRALRLGCDTFQIFTRNPRSWSSRTLAEEEVECFKRKLNRSGITLVFAHTPYVQNLASPQSEIYRKSVDSLALELKRCTKLEIPFLVTHLGSHLGSGTKKGVDRVANALNTAIRRTQSPVKILMETNSGSGNRVGSNFEELKLILEAVEYEDSVAVCFDTCHTFAAGYRLRTFRGLRKTISVFDKTVGLEKLILVHLNDSRGDRGSGIDQHDHIGLGKIGEKGLKVILRSLLAERPMILETPVDTIHSDYDNMRKVRELSSSSL